MALACRQLHFLHQSQCFHPPECCLYSRFPQQSKHFFRMSQSANVLWHHGTSKLFPVAASQKPSTEPSSKGSDKSVGKRRRSDLPPELEEIATPLPQPPNYFLWAAGALLLYITRHAVATELIRWVSVGGVIGVTLIQLAQRILGAVLPYTVQLLYVPLSLVLTLLGWAGLFTRDLYIVIINTVAVWPTLRAVLLVTMVLSLGETTRSAAVSGQTWTFLFVTLLAMGAVLGVVHHTVFVFLLLFSVGYSLLVQKKDAVSAFMPVTAVLVAIAEPPVKAVAFGSFLALSVYSHWRRPGEQANIMDHDKRIVHPIIMVAAAMVLGITVASRYLDAWQVLWLAK